MWPSSSEETSEIKLLFLVWKIEAVDYLENSQGVISDLVAKFSDYSKITPNQQVYIYAGKYLVFQMSKKYSGAFKCTFNTV